MDPFFSVIIPIYNVDKYLEKCIESIIVQEYNDVEIILVDDGSTDNSAQICDTYGEKDCRIRVIHKENGGLVSARQTGAALSKGRFILNIDGDDWVTPNYFFELDRIAKTYDPDMICFGAEFVSDKQRIKHPGCKETGLYTKEQISKKIYPVLIENDQGEYFSPAIWAKAIRRDIYIKCQMAVDKRITIGEDHAVTKPAIYMSNSIYLSDSCLYCYRQNPSSMTKAKKVLSWDGPRLIGKLFEKQLDVNSYDFQEQINRYITHNVFNVAVSQFNREATYREIKTVINNEIDEPFINSAINQAKYSRLINKLAGVVLKRKLIVVIYFYAHMKR